MIDGREELCFDTKEAAAYLGVVVRTIYRYVKDGILPRLKKGSGRGRNLFRKSDLDAMIRKDDGPSGAMARS
jgi:excisionase family DNA binding protein